MNPKKPKVIIEKTAKEMELDETLVHDLTSFYWSRLRKALINLEYPIINIEGLGHLTIRPIKLNDITIEYKQILKHINPKYFQNFHRMKDLELKVDKLDKMALMLEKVEKLKIDHKTKRSEYEKEKQNKSEEDLGDQE